MGVTRGATATCEFHTQGAGGTDATIRAVTRQCRVYASGDGRDQAIGPTRALVLATRHETTSLHARMPGLPHPVPPQDWYAHPTCTAALRMGSEIWFAMRSMGRRTTGALEDPLEGGLEEPAPLVESLPRLCARSGVGAPEACDMYGFGMVAFGLAQGAVTRKIATYSWPVRYSP